MASWVLGVLGGSGLYAIDGLAGAEWREVETPWGPPSDELLFGRLGAVDLVFLPRHGRGHRLAPGEVPARANIHALKAVGCTDLLSVSAVGSLREDLEPGRFVVVDQFVDRTVARPRTFFGDGVVAHISLAEPVCPVLSGMAADAARTAGAPVTAGGTYLAIEGPALSTKAESRLYRQWGMDVIGMTAMPEARLAREAELPYACVGMVTDWDCWRDDVAHVEVSNVLEQLAANAQTGTRLIEAFAQALPPTRAPSPLDTVLDSALITPPEAIGAEARARLGAILARRLA